MSPRFLCALPHTRARATNGPPMKVHGFAVRARSVRFTFQVGFKLHVPSHVAWGIFEVFRAACSVCVLSGTPCVGVGVGVGCGVWGVRCGVWCMVWCGREREEGGRGGGGRRCCRERVVHARPRSTLSLGILDHTLQFSERSFSGREEWVECLNCGCLAC